MSKPYTIPFAELARRPASLTAQRRSKRECERTSRPFTGKLPGCLRLGLDRGEDRSGTRFASRIEDADQTLAVAAADTLRRTLRARIVTIGLGEAVNEAPPFQLVPFHFCFAAGYMGNHKKFIVTGLTEIDAMAQGYEIETVLLPAYDRPHFFPGAKAITLKLVAERETGRLLGVQAVGSGVVDKRIDVAATALTFGATVQQLSQLEPRNAMVFYNLACSYSLTRDFDRAVDSLPVERGAVLVADQLEGGGTTALGDQHRFPHD